MSLRIILILRPHIAPAGPLGQGARSTPGLLGVQRRVFAPTEGICRGDYACDLVRHLTHVTVLRRVNNHMRSVPTVSEMRLAMENGMTWFLRSRCAHAES